MTMQNIDKDFLEGIILQCLDLLYTEDHYLIEHQPSDWVNYGGDPEGVKNSHVGERAIVFRFGLYFWDKIRTIGLKQFDLDCEYNRNLYSTKNFPGFVNGTYPDLILHKRGSNSENIIVLEFKTWWNKSRSRDIKKIQGLMNEAYDYRYKYGVSILLAKTRDKCNVKWIQVKS